MKAMRLLWLFPVVMLVLVAAGAWWLLHGDEESSASAQEAAAVAMLKDPAVIAKGQYLVAAGDCVSCHTAQGGPLYAGGRLLPTPFGNIAAPNITPDVETGLGRWHFEDFWRALHFGIGKHGERLYPAFTYTAFTKVTRDDAVAMFAYLQSLPPVHQPAQSSILNFPYNLRGGLVVWRALYFRPGIYQPNSQQSASWNRGAYLVKGLGHCNECHAVRDSWGGVSGSKPLSGGRIPMQDWYAPDLSTQANGGLQGWSRQDIVDLLKTGQSSKGAAFGPMAEVVADSTQYLHDDDLQAIADYLQSLPPRTVAITHRDTLDHQAQIDHGGDIYAHHCASCHGKDGAGVAGVYPPLDGNSSVMEPIGINAARMVLFGGFPPVTQGNPRPYSMPPFAQSLSDADVAAVVTYIRQAWSNQAAPVLERDVVTYRHTPIN